MKIAILRDGPLSPATTGGAYVVNNLLDHFCKKGHEVYLFRCFRGWENPEDYKNKKYTTLLFKPNDYYNDLILLSRLINKYQIDILLFDSTEAVCWQGKYLKKTTKAKIVYQAHNIDSVLLSRMQASKAEIDEAIINERRSALIADLTLAMSEFDKDCLKELGVKNNVVVCPTAANLDIFEFKSKRIKQNQVVFMGNLDYKPNETAVDIIANQILPHLGNDSEIKFLIIGKGGGRLSKKYSQKKLIFVGEVEDLNEYLQSSFAGICPIIEGSGTRLKILDYMAAGIPVISSNLGIEGLEAEIRDCIYVEDNFSDYPKLFDQLLHEDNSEISLKALAYLNKYRSWDTNINFFINAFELALKQ